MHLRLCHDLNGILDTSIVLLLNLQRTRMVSWFRNEEIVQLDCIFKRYGGVLGPLIERISISIRINGTVQINDKIYHLSKPKISDFFDEIRINLGSEKTYRPLLCGECSCHYTLHLKSGKVIEYSGNYALCDGTPYGCERYTKKIVDNWLKQVIDSFWEFI